MKQSGSRWIRSLKNRITVGSFRRKARVTFTQPPESLVAGPTLGIALGISISAIESLENYFRDGGVSIVQAAFAHTYFVHPDRVKERTPYYPDRARFSRRLYPGLGKGSSVKWPGDGREVQLDDNQYAQNAWERYTGHPIARGSGYGLRHIWGNPWNPNAFTAGWNFCYMPFWAGMLTESQHPHPKLEEAIRQASWDLYFRDNPVCQPPEFVENPGLDLDSVLAGQPILLLHRNSSSDSTQSRSRRPNVANSYESDFEHVKAIRAETHQSWINIRKASRSLQGKDHEAFGTRNVENSAKSCVRKIHRETGLSFAQIETLLDRHGLGNELRE